MIIQRTLPYPTFVRYTVTISNFSGCHDSRYRKGVLEINVAEEHRDYLRCIWFEDVFAKVSEMCKSRFCRVIFRAAPSQFLLNGAVKMVANNYKEPDSEFVEKVRRGFYLDDLCSGPSHSKKGYEF